MQPKFTSYQKELVDALGDGSYDGSYNERIDSFVFTCLRRDHPEFEAVEDERSEWARLYSVEHGDFWLKGVAVLRPGETDVGLRFYP